MTLLIMVCSQFFFHLSSALNNLQISRFRRLDHNVQDFMGCKGKLMTHLNLGLNSKAHLLLLMKKTQQDNKMKFDQPRYDKSGSLAFKDYFLSEFSSFNYEYSIKCLLQSICTKPKRPNESKQKGSMLQELTSFLVCKKLLYFTKTKMDNPDLKGYAKALGIDQSKLSDIGSVRMAFKRNMLDPSIFSDRKKRIKVNQAYSQVCAIIYKSKVSQFQLLIIEGNLPALQKKIKQDKKSIDQKINQYPPIYLAVRCGHYDVVEFFLKAGCSLDFRKDRSTPMHCAAYYGYHSIIPLLFMFGIPTNIKNAFGHLPLQQASSDQIKRLLEVAQKSVIKQLHENLLNQGLGVAIINLKEGKTGKVVVKKLIHKNYFQYWNHPQYDNAYHGTHVDNLFSIMKNGLRRPGDKVQGAALKVAAGHIPLGTNLHGYKDWSKAIFLSPSIYYSAHPVYAKEFIDSGEVWLPLLQVKVKKESYSRHDHTLRFYDVKNDEPTQLEFRVTCCDENENLIIRSQQVGSVVVIATILIKKGFLDDHDNYQETSQHILHSEEQKNFRKHNFKC